MITSISALGSTLPLTWTTSLSSKQRTTWNNNQHVNNIVELRVTDEKHYCAVDKKIWMISINWFFSKLKSGLWKILHFNGRSLQKKNVILNSNQILFYKINIHQTGKGECSKTMTTHVMIIQNKTQRRSWSPKYRHEKKNNFIKMNS